MTVYQVRKRFSDGRGAARVDKDGDLNVSFPKPPGQAGSTVSGFFKKPKEDDEDDNDELLDDHDHGPDVNEDRHEAWRFLLAGGVAGAGESVNLLHSNPQPTLRTLPHTSARCKARPEYVLMIVSRSVTAPFDRLKIYLITTTHTHYNAEAIAASNHSGPVKMGWRAIGNLWGAVKCIYADGGGTRAFWVGNGLNVTKIFPVSRQSVLPISWRSVSLGHREGFADFVRMDR